MTDEPQPGDQLAEELLDLLASWKRHLRSPELDLSPRTLRTYTQSFNSFVRYVRAAPDAPRDVTQVDQDFMREWLVQLKEQGRSANTLSTRFANLRTFFVWLVEEGEIGVSPMAGMKQPKVREQPVAVLPIDALKALLETCSGRGFTDFRDDAILRAYSDGGMRLTECAMLDLSDVDMEQQVFWVRGKGGRMRAVPFGNRTARSVDRYLRKRKRHPKAKETDRLWIGRKGPLGPEGVRAMLDRRAQRAGLDHIHPHQLRHTAAHQLRLAGMNDQDMKRIFGWRSSRMLERYGASAADERARESHRRLSLGDRL